MIKNMNIDKNMQISEDREIMNKLTDYSIEDYFIDAIKENIIIDYNIIKYQNYIEISTYDEQKAREYFVEKGFNKISIQKQISNGNRPVNVLIVNRDLIKMSNSISVKVIRVDGTIEDFGTNTENGWSNKI